eukprot:17415-Alexandrium_andersonii.AAC.1
MLNGVRAPNARPSACGAPSMRAPGKVRAHIHSERDPFVLPREVVDALWAHDQVPIQPDQHRPIRGGGVRHFAAELLSREPQVRAIKAK